MLMMHMLDLVRLTVRICIWRGCGWAVDGPYMLLYVLISLLLQFGSFLMCHKGWSQYIYISNMYVDSW